MAEPTAANPAERGRLEVRDAVIEHLAQRAVLDVDGVVRSSSGLTKMMGRDVPRAHASIAGERVRAELEIAVVWPHPVSRTAAAARDHVRKQLHALTGLQIDAIDVTVTTLVAGAEADRTRRRVQ